MQTKDEIISKKGIFLMIHILSSFYHMWNPVCVNINFCDIKKHYFLEIKYFHLSMIVREYIDITLQIISFSIDTKTHSTIVYEIDYIFVNYF